MATFTPQQGGLGGTTLTFNAVDSGGDEFANDGRTYVIAQNTSGASRTFDIVTTQTVTSQNLAVDDLDCSVADGDTDLFGPFAVNTFGSTTTIQNYNATTGIAIAILKV